MPSLVYCVHATIGPRCVHFRKTYIVIYLPYHIKFSTLSKFIIIVCCIISLTLQDYNFKLPSWWMLYWSYLFQLMLPLPSSYFGGERSDLFRGYCLSCNLLFSLLMQSMLRKAWENINPIVVQDFAAMRNGHCGTFRRMQGGYYPLSIVVLIHGGKGPRKVGQVPSWAGLKSILQINQTTSFMGKVPQKTLPTAAKSGTITGAGK